MKLAHGLLALRAVAGREVYKFLRQPGRLLSSLVRPALWLVVFASGFQNVFGVALSVKQVCLALPLVILGALMLAALGLVLSVHVKQLENFAGTMNFVIFPMFFLSSALYPLWKIQESGANWIYQAARWNPFS